MEGSGNVPQVDGLGDHVEHGIRHEEYLDRTGTESVAHGRCELFGDGSRRGEGKSRNWDCLDALVVQGKEKLIPNREARELVERDAIGAGGRNLTQVQR